MGTVMMMIELMRRRRRQQPVLLAKIEAYSFNPFQED